MNGPLQDVFADTAYWVALVIKQDQYHAAAQRVSLQISGRIVTTQAVLLETGNTLSRPAWRNHAVALLDLIDRRTDVDTVGWSHDLWKRGCDLFRSRSDKAWSLTDCISFVVMSERKLTDALTADTHFRQAGFRPLLLDASFSSN